MNTIVLILLGIVIVATLTFLAVLFRLSLDDADFWLKVISGVLAAFTFLAGAAALFTGTILGNRQDERVATLEKATAEANQKRAEADLRLEELRKRQEPRRLNWDAFVATLKGKPRGTVVIEYQPNDREAHFLASELHMALSASQWSVSQPQPARPSPYGLPPILNDGVTVVANNIDELEPPPKGEDTPLRSLHAAVFASLGMARASRDDSLPDNVFRLLVGPKN